MKTVLNMDDRGWIPLLTELLKTAKSREEFVELCCEEFGPENLAILTMNPSYGEDEWGDYDTGRSAAINKRMIISGEVILAIDVSVNI